MYVFESDQMQNMKRWMNIFPHFDKTLCQHGQQLDRDSRSLHWKMLIPTTDISLNSIGDKSQIWIWFPRDPVKTNMPTSFILKIQQPNKMSKFC